MTEQQNKKVLIQKQRKLVLIEEEFDNLDELNDMDLFLKNNFGLDIVKSTYDKEDY
jgi:hypothetical protein